MFSRRSFLHKLTVAGGVVLTPISRIAQVINPDSREKLLQIDNFVLNYKDRVSSTDHSSSFSTISELQKYTDPEFGFTLDYPNDWEFATRIHQEKPYRVPNAILKRIEFSGPKGFVNLDIWDSHNHEIGEWMKWWHDWTGAKRESHEPSEPNAKIFQMPALTFLEPGGVGSYDSLLAFFTDKKYIYRLMSILIDPASGVDIFSTMVKSLDHAMLKKTSPVLPFMEINVSSVITPYEYVNECCTYTTRVNCPFRCVCATNLGLSGNCTWWVFYSYGYVPFTGDARLWWGQTANFPDWTKQYNSPPMNQRSIPWWNAGTTVGKTTGHVAYLNNYTGDTTIRPTAMFYCTTVSPNCVSAPPYSKTDPGGYIFEKIL